MSALRLAFFAVLLALALPGAAAEPDHWARIASAVAAEIAKAEAMAVEGHAEEAKKALTRAYFGLFEDEKMEAALRKTFGFKHAYRREQEFGNLRKLIGKNEPVEIRRLSLALRNALADDGRALDKAGVSPDVFEVNQ